MHCYKNFRNLISYRTLKPLQDFGTHKGPLNTYRTLGPIQNLWDFLVKLAKPYETNMKKKVYYVRTNGQSDTSGAASAAKNTWPKI